MMLALTLVMSLSGCYVWWYVCANFEKYLDLWEPYVGQYDATLPKKYQNYGGLSCYCLDGRAAFLVNVDVFAELGLNPDDFDSYEDLLMLELKVRIAMGNPANSTSVWAELTNMLFVKGDKPYDEKA